MSEEVVRSEYLYRGRILKLRLDQVRLNNKTMTVREIVEHRGAAAIVALDDQERVLLVRQYRSAAERDMLEIPAGTLEEGETPAECASRELLEEAGCHAGHWEPLGYFYPSPGYSTEIIHLYLAYHLLRNAPSPEADEEITLEALPVTQAIDKIEQGEIVDGKSIVALLRTRKMLDKLRGRT
jgi:ADP-ribose pyrophosphatase